MLACDEGLTEAVRRDAFVLWELGVPVVFTGPAEGLTEACAAYAARLGHPEAACLPAGDAAALRAAVESRSAPRPASRCRPPG